MPRYVLLAIIASVSCSWPGAYAQTAPGGAAVWAQGDDSKAVTWSGSSSTIDGPVHSNGGIRVRGSSNSVTGETTWVSQFDSSGSGHSYSPLPQQVAVRTWPLSYRIEDYMPGGAAALAAGSDYVDLSAACAMSSYGADDDEHDESDDHDDHRYCKNGTHHHGHQSVDDDDDDDEGGKGQVSIAFHDEPVPGRLYWAPCDISFSAKDAVGPVTIVSTGKVHLKAHKNSNLTSYADGLIALSAYDGNKAIHLNGHRSTLHGNFVAEHGEIHLAGSRQALSCGIYADNIKISGSRIEIAAGDCSTVPENSPPLAADDSASTAESTPVSIPVLANDSDVDGILDVASVTIIDAPLNGSASPDPATGAITYAPASGFFGTDSFTYLVADNEGALSNVANVVVTVASVNEPPAATDDAFTVDEDNAATFNVLQNDHDPDGQLVVGSVLVVVAPPNGTTVVDELTGNITYTPDPDFFGLDTFQYTVADNESAVSESATVDVTVQSVNDAPVAQPDSFTFPEDTTTSLSLLANDTDVDSVLTAASINVVVQAANGTVAVDAATGDIIYTPDQDYTGSDQFEYELVDDQGAVSEARALVQLEITPVNDAPVAVPAIVSVAEDGSVSIVLDGTDVDGDSMTFTVVTQPQAGNLSGTAPALIYSPLPDYFGSDSFTFRVSDGQVDSPAVTVTIDVQAINDPPVAGAQSIAIDEDSTASVVLSATDVDGDPLTYTVTQSPSNGVLLGTAPDLQYVPDPDFNGNDSFQFVVSDGTANTDPVDFAITVLAVNDAPVATPQNVTIAEDGTLSVTLLAQDVDGDTLTFEVVQSPANGALQGTLPNLQYTPQPDFSGSDSFTFIASDGVLQSDPAEVVIAVSPVNDAPVAADQQHSTSEDVPLDQVLSAVDVENDFLTFRVVAAPTAGALEGQAPNLRYVPAADYFGSDSFTFVANDGEFDSAIATVSLTVVAANDSPQANAQQLATAEDTPLDIVLTGTDVDGDTLEYVLSSSPLSGSLSGVPPSLVYKPAADFNGVDSLSFTVSDGIATSAPAVVQIDVTPVNDAPSANAASVDLLEDQVAGITLNGSDPDGDSITFAIVDSPANGSLSGTPPDLSYTPQPDFNGSDAFTFQVSDGVLLSPVVAVTLTIQPVNDAPVAADASYAAQAGTPLDIVLSASDVDGDALLFTVTTLPVNGTVTGTPPNLVYTANIGFSGTDSFTFVANDGVVDSASATVELAVSDPNNDPAITSTPLTDATVLGDYSYQVVATDPDGDALVYSLGTSPAGMTISATGLIEWQPTAAGAYAVAVNATDGRGGSAQQSYTILVSQNLPPEFTRIPLLNAPRGEPYSASGEVVDPDGDAVTITLLSGPPGSSLDDLGNGTFVINWVATGRLGDVTPFSITATDSNGASANLNIGVITVGEATNKSHLGTDFWFGYGINFRNTNFGLGAMPLTDPGRKLQAVIGAPDGAVGILEIPGLAFSEAISLAPGETATIDLPIEAMGPLSTTVQNKGVHVSTDRPVTVAGVNWAFATTDAFLVMPTPTLGSKYVVTGFKDVLFPTTSIEITWITLATEDNTTVTVTPIGDIPARQAGQAILDPETYTLNRGEYISGDTWYTHGADITADRPLAVFAGSSCSDVPEGTGTCDHLWQQFVPADSLANEYLAAPIATRVASYYRVVAADDDTRVFINGYFAAKLDRGQKMDRMIEGPVNISSSKPVIAIQYAVGNEFDTDVRGDGNADPFMLNLAPVDSFLSDYVFVVPSGEGVFRDQPNNTPRLPVESHFLSIVIPAEIAASLLLDGVPVDTSGFEPIIGSEYLAGIVEVTPGTHRMAASDSFGVAVYGFGVQESYGYYAGLSAPDPRTDLALSVTGPAGPLVAGQQEACFDISITDIGGEPVPRARFTVDAAGTAPLSHVGFTGDTGDRQFCYTQAAPGTEIVTVTTAGDSYQQAVDWLLNSDPGSNGRPAITSLPEVVLYEQTFTYPITTVDPDGDAVALTLPEAPAGVSIVNNVLQWTPPIPEDREPTRHEFTIVATDARGAATEQRFELTVFYPPAFVEPYPSTRGIQLFGARYSSTFKHKGGDYDRLVAEMIAGPGTVFWAGIVGSTPIFNIDGQSQHIEAPEYPDAQNVMCRISAESTGQFSFVPVWQDTSVGSVRIAVGGPVFDTNSDGIVDNDDRIYAAYARSDAFGLYDLESRQLVWETPAGPVSDLSEMALANVDSDPELELLAVTGVPGDNFGRLTAFDADGSILWRSSFNPSVGDYLLHLARMPVLAADLDNDGQTEIIHGPYVYDNAGNLLWQFDANRVGSIRVRLAVPHVADLDGDGRKEVLFQTDVRDADGNLLWSLPYPVDSRRPDVLYATGDLTGDGTLEVFASIEASNGTFHQAFSADGAPLWPAITGLALSKPVIGDFDRDGDSEIFVPSQRAFISADGRLLSSDGGIYAYNTFQPLTDLDQDGVPERLRPDGFRLSPEEVYAPKGWPLVSVDSVTRQFARPLAWQDAFFVDVDHDGDSEYFIGGTSGIGLFESGGRPFPLATRQFHQALDFNQPVMGLDTDFGTPQPTGLADAWVGKITLTQITEQEFSLSAEVRNLGMRPINLPFDVQFYSGRVASNQLLGTVQVADLAIGEVRTVSVSVADTDLDFVMSAAIVLDASDAQCQTGNDIVEGELHTIELRDGPTPYRRVSHSYLHQLRFASGDIRFTATPPNPSSVEHGQTFQFDTDADWWDPQSAISNSIIYSLDATSLQRGITINTLTGELQWTPRFEHIGAHTVTITASSIFDVRSIFFTLNVTARANEVPVIGTLPPGTPVPLGQSYAYDVDATDADGDLLTYALTTAPVGMSIDPATGLISWTPAASQQGAHPVTVTVDDGFGGVATQSFTVNVASAANSPPELTSVPPNSGKATFEYRYQVVASDPDNDPLTYTVQTGPSGMVIDSNGLLTWTPPAPVVADVVIRVNDGQAFIDQGWTVQVSDASIPLKASIGVSPSVAELGSTVTVTVGYSGAAGQVSAGLTIDGQSVPLGIDFTAVVPADAVGQHTATVVISDPYSSDSASTTYTVIDSSDPTPAPVVSLVAPDFEQEVTAPTDVIGSVTDDNLTRWFVALQEKGAPPTEFTILAEGTSAFPEGVITRIDPTMLMNGLYSVVLQAEDASGNVSSDSRVIRITGDLKVGNFSVTFEDLNVPVAGLPVTVLRTYDSRRRNEELDFGYGWSVDYQNVRLQESRDIGFSWSLIEEDKGFFSDFCVRPNGDPTVTVRMPDGEVESFVARAEPECTSITPTVDVIIVFEPIDGTDSTLEQVDFGTVRINNNNIVDLGSPDTPIDPDNYRLTTPEGLVFELDQNFGIRQVTEPNGSTLTYSDNGIVHSQGFSLDFTRDAAGRITAITAPDGTSLNYGYDGNGDLVSFTDQVLQTTTFTYRADLPHYLEDIVDPRGITVARNEYDANGRLEAHIDADGNRIEYTHDINGRTETIRDRRGNATTYVYDDEGNVLVETNALGESIIRTYDEDRNETSMTDGLGNTTSWTYDERSNQLTETDPLGNVTTSTYDDRNLLLTVVDALGNAVMTNVYDANNTNLLTLTDALGNTTTFHWDSAIGSCSTGASRGITDAEGNRTTIQPFCAGPFAELPAWEEDARGTRTSYVHDSLGRRTTETTVRTDENGVEQTLITTMAYDDKGRVTQVTDPEGNVTITEYNVIDKESATIDANGNRTEFEYDARGNLVLTRYADGTTESMDYDAEGNVIAQTDRLGRSTLMNYDAANRLLETIYPDNTPGNDLDNSRTINEYDDAGRMTASIDERGNRTEYEYDTAGRRTLVRDALLNETTFEYDERGLRTAMVDALSRRTEFVYDIAGRLVQTVFPDATPGDSTDNPRSVTGYDALGRKVAETDLAGLTTQFEYDPLGNLTAVVDALNQRTEYGYDEQSNKISQTDAENRTTTWAYDNAGRVTSRTLPLGQLETYGYDANGNRTSHVDFNGALHAFNYDDLNRETTATYADGVIVTTTYTDVGQVATVTDDRGTTTYGYDERDRLVSISYPTGKSITYVYDAAGNRTSLSTANQLVSYGFDALNRLSTVTDEAGVTSYGYDAVGNRASIDYPNGTRTEYSYDEQNRLLVLSQLDTASMPFARHSYTLGANGNRLQHAELSGRVVDYSYDDLYRLTLEDVTDPAVGNRTTSFGYDAVGNRLTQTETTAAGTTTTTYSYDSNDRLQNEVATGAEPGTTTYGYDANGNTLSKTDGSGTTGYGWDSRNRLTDLNNGQTAYRYDAAGIRMSETTGGLTTQYLVDPNRDYAQVIEESLDLNAFAEVRYSYGDDLLSQHRRLDATTSRSSTYHYDGIGSTRQLTDATGVVTDNYAFAAFGEVEGQSGITANDYLYTGEQIDPNLGFYYLRARYYQPGVGRFVGMDAFAGRMHEPITVHKYLYASGNPTNFIDPSGKISIAELNVVTSIRGLIGQFQLDGGLASADILGVQNPAISGVRKANFLFGIASLGGAGVKLVKYFSTKFQRQKFSFRFTPAQRGPLHTNIAATFRSSTYTAKYATKNTILYRSYGGRSKPEGSFWSRTKPSGNVQNKLDAALLDEFGNTQSGIAIIEVPEGTIMYEGIAGPQFSKDGTQVLLGGGNQVYLQSVDPEWFIE